MLACLHSYMHTCIPAYLHACMDAYIHACFNAFSVKYLVLIPNFNYYFAFVSFAGNITQRLNLLQGPASVRGILIPFGRNPAKA